MLLPAVFALALLAEPDTYFTITWDNGGIYLVDPSTIKRNGSKLTFWTLWVNTKPEKLPYSHQFESYVLEKEEVDCAADKRRKLALVSYDLAGNQIGPPNTHASWLDIIPGSVGQTLERFACSTTPPASKSRTGSLQEITKQVRAELVAGSLE